MISTCMAACSLRCGCCCQGGRDREVVPGTLPLAAKISGGAGMLGIVALAASLMYTFMSKPGSSPPLPPPGVSIRVAKALGSRGYDKVRVSLITWGSSDSSPDCGQTSYTCSKNVDWAMEVGIKQHPDWYPGLSE